VKRFKLSKEATQIGAWIIPHDIIDDICDYWDNPENDKRKVTGSIGKYNIGNAIDIDVKDSIEIEINSNNFDKPWDKYRKYLQDCLDDYLLQYPNANEVMPFNLLENYNLQWYPKGGGYKDWHHENPGSVEYVHRHLVFMTYCNDLPNAGTHFKHQNITTPSIKGLTLIWASGFTHTHKGQITEEHEKMIVTGWYNFVDVFNKLDK